MTNDQAIFVVVLALRLGVPLLIFRYPLPAILAALVIDAADQTIFQNYTDLDLANYQGYDKALDIYYLAIAYLSTFRNWADPFAARTAQFLWYYRLVGVLLFELLGARALLLVFPNTFEYFFICYEVVRLAWNPARLSHRQVIGLAAVIWIFVKLPQEWWIHVAQLDFTDFMKEDVFGVDASTSWSTAIGENLWFLGLLVALAVIATLLVRWALRTAPPPDWPVSVDVDDHPTTTRVGAEPVVSARVFDWDLCEKVALMALITIIFSEVLPGTEASPLEVTWAVSLVVVANAVVSQVLSRRGHSWTSTFTEFAGTVAVNAAIIAVYLAVIRRSDRPVDEGAVIFFLLLISLIVALFDRYRPRRVSGFGPSAHEPVERPAPAS